MGEIVEFRVIGKTSVSLPIMYGSIHKTDVSMNAKKKKKKDQESVIISDEGQSMGKGTSETIKEKITWERNERRQKLEG